MKDSLRCVERSPEEFNALLNILGEDELKFFGYDYFYFNLLSVFRDKLAVQEIKRLAIECNKSKLRSGWESCRYVFELTKGYCKPSVRLDKWNSEMLKSLLARGRGLVVATAHLGPFRQITADLLLMGFKVCIAVDGESATQMKNLVGFLKGVQNHTVTSKQQMQGELLGEAVFRTVDVERNRLATLELLGVLRKNEIVVMYVDGNTGLDGPHGYSNRIPLLFLGRPCLVKSGIARLAISSGAALVHIVARSRAHQDPEIGLQYAFEVRSGTCVEDRAQQASELTQALYRQMETCVLCCPEQWESACLFHRWRATEPRVATWMARDKTETLHMWRQHGALRLRRERVALVNTKRGQMLIDVENLRTFHIGTAIGPIVSKLYKSELSYDCFEEGMSAQQQENVGELVNRLHSLKCIEPVPAAYRSPAEQL